MLCQFPFVKLRRDQSANGGDLLEDLFSHIKQYPVFSLNCNGYIDIIMAVVIPNWSIHYTAGTVMEHLNQQRWRAM